MGTPVMVYLVERTVTPVDLQGDSRDGLRAAEATSSHGVVGHPRAGLTLRRSCALDHHAW